MDNVYLNLPGKLLFGVCSYGLASAVMFAHVPAGGATTSSIGLRELIPIQQNAEQEIRSGSYDVFTTTILLFKPEETQKGLSPPGLFGAQRFAFNGVRTKSDEMFWSESPANPTLHEIWSYDGRETRSLNGITRTGIIRTGACGSFTNWFQLLHSELGTTEPLSQYLARLLNVGRPRAIGIQPGPDGDVLVFDYEAIILGFAVDRGYFPVRQVIYLNRARNVIFEDRACSDLSNYQGIWWPRIVQTATFGASKQGAWVQTRTDTQEFTSVTFNTDLNDAQLTLIYDDRNDFFRDERTGVIHTPLPPIKP